VSIALQRAWATYILKCDIIVGESSFGLSVFLGFQFLFFLYASYNQWGLSNMICFDGPFFVTHFMFCSFGLDLGPLP
jgi:hypothetical protein